MDRPRPTFGGGAPERVKIPGCTFFFLLLTALLVAILVFWAWQRNPPDAPNPSATGTPQSMPVSDGS